MKKLSNKHRGTKTRVDGILFHSKLESMFYSHLKSLKEQGIVEKFEMQVPFQLLDPFQTKSGEMIRGIKYISDFVVWYVGKDQPTVIDTKGWITPIFSIKKKLLLHRYPDIDFQIIKYVRKYGGWLTWEEWEAKKRASQKSSGRQLDPKKARQ